MNETPIPKLSIIVVIYNMRREIPRTLQSLQAVYQQGTNEDDYEVIVIENGSSDRFSEDAVRQYGRNFRYYYLDNPPPSPAYAVNFGLGKSRGEYAAVMVDGARMVSPGIISYTLNACRQHDQPVILVPSWHLGPDFQQNAAATGYNQQVEDQLLERIRWPVNGYDLFRISVLAPSARRGLFINPGESNFLTMPLRLFLALGGYEERFDTPGGGLVNQDMLLRALGSKGTQYIILLGEGTFHQIHGGASTNTTDGQSVWPIYSAQYEKIRGKIFRRSQRQAEYYGHIPQQLWPHLKYSSDTCLQLQSRNEV